MSDAAAGFFTIVWVEYRCGNGHALLFGHGVDRRWRFASGSPAACLSCGTAFVYAELKYPEKYLKRIP